MLKLKLVQSSPLGKTVLNISNVSNWYSEWWCWINIVLTVFLFELLQLQRGLSARIKNSKKKNESGKGSSTSETKYVVKASEPFSAVEGPWFWMPVISIVSFNVIHCQACLVISPLFYWKWSTVILTWFSTEFRYNKMLLKAILTCEQTWLKSICFCPNQWCFL